MGRAPSSKTPLGESLNTYAAGTNVVVVPYEPRIAEY
jgi:hypothetical protein